MEGFLLALVMSVIGGALANPEAKRLYDDLLSNYNRLIRPVGNNSDKLTVKMGLRLAQLIDVVSSLSLLFTSISILFIWFLFISKLLAPQTNDSDVVI